MLGGAMYALERGLNMKWLGMTFRRSGERLTSFGIGCGVQVNAISSIVNSSGSHPVRRLKNLRLLIHTPGSSAWPLA